MKPTLFANDFMVNRETDNDRLLFSNDTAAALRRILPRRCPADKDEYAHMDVGCGCGGERWLYPDPPDWWDMIEHDGDLLNNWERHCARTWQAMGITD